MKLIPVSTLFDFVLKTSLRHNIDESHAVKHSMDVFFYANKILHKENLNQCVRSKNIVNVCASLHDMCDSKYVNEDKGWVQLEELLQPNMNPKDLHVSKNIIMTMSYSKVIKNGFPTSFSKEDLLLYHIIREADLLTSYDFERCIIYAMYKKNIGYKEAFIQAEELFNNRMFMYLKNNLFVTNYSKKEASRLHQKATQKIIDLKKYIL
jgi:hypothetical protein